MAPKLGNPCPKCRSTCCTAQQEPSWCSRLTLHECVHRWPRIAGQASKPEGGWKRLYLQHDAQDMHQALDGVPPEMQHIYREVGS